MMHKGFWWRNLLESSQLNTEKIQEVDIKVNWILWKDCEDVNWLMIMSSCTVVLVMLNLQILLTVN